MSMTETDTRRQLAEVQRLLAKTAAQVCTLEGLRDRLILTLTDLDGAHDRRFAGVR